METARYVFLAEFLHEGSRIREPVTEDAYRAWFQGGTKWMNATFRKLGWKIPKDPPFPEPDGPDLVATRPIVTEYPVAGTPLVTLVKELALRRDVVSVRLVKGA